MILLFGKYLLLLGMTNIHVMLGDHYAFVGTAAWGLVQMKLFFYNYRKSESHFILF